MNPLSHENTPAGTPGSIHSTGRKLKASAFSKTTAGLLKVGIQSVMLGPFNGVIPEYVSADGSLLSCWNRSCIDVTRENNDLTKRDLQSMFGIGESMRI